MEPLGISQNVRNYLTTFHFCSIVLFFSFFPLFWWLFKVSYFRVLSTLVWNIVYVWWHLSCIERLEQALHFGLSILIRIRFFFRGVCVVFPLSIFSTRIALFFLSFNMFRLLACVCCGCPIKYDGISLHRLLTPYIALWRILESGNCNQRFCISLERESPRERGVLAAEGWNERINEKDSSRLL